jgi:hypothetical protein
MGDKKEVSNRFIEAHERLLGEGLVTVEGVCIQGGRKSIDDNRDIEGRSSVGTSAIQNIVQLYGISGIGSHWHR